MPGADGQRHEVLVVGGGNAGISLAARLLRDGVRDVAVVAPQPVHRYKPLLNYVGAGEATMADLERPMADVVPGGCTWIRDAVGAVDPVALRVRTRGGRLRSLRSGTVVFTVPPEPASCGPTALKPLLTACDQAADRRPARPRRPPGPA